MKREKEAKAVIASCIFVLALCPAGLARIIYVDNDAPADFTTIQAAIDDANDGDTIIICPGTYTGPGNRDIRFKAKAITVRSSDPNDPDVVAATLIDCEGTDSDPHRGFYFYSSDKPNSVLAGLTVSQGYAVEGGGVFCYEYASPTIRNCHLICNHAVMRGGGIYIGWGTPIIRNCIIVGNSVSNALPGGKGGGICCDSSRTPITISGCTIVGNSASGLGANPGAGGGMYLSIYSGSVQHCTIIGNSAEMAGGIYCDAYGGMTITNCIVRSNKAPQGAQISGTSSVTYSNVEGGWFGIGNIDANPLFADLASGDYHLSAGSPCIDTGDPQYVPYAGQTDCDNEPRVMGLRADMGADEFTSSPTAVLNVHPKQLVFHADANGPSPKRQVLHVQDAGFAPLTWDVSEDCPWLDTGDLADGTEGLSLGVDVAGLTPGRYDCQVTITADHVPNSPQAVAVSLYVRGGKYLYMPWPYRTIQSAVESAQDGDTIVMEEGTYTGLGNRDIDFLGKAITVRGTDPNDPGVVAATIMDCGGTDGAPHRGFVFHSGEDTNSVLAGLTITGGFADGGGGVYVDGSSPTILRCNITGNTCTLSGDGGGICVRVGSPYIGQCLIADNRYEGSRLSRGGGIYCSGSPVIVDCAIRSNQAKSRGGGIFFGGGSPVVSNCVIAGNEVKNLGGGGICLEDANGVLSHCVIAENRSGDTGGAISLRRSELTIRNCTIAGNTAGHLGGGVYFSQGKLSVTNTILWDNEGSDGSQIAVYAWNGIYDGRGDYYRLTGTVDVWASDVEGGQPNMYIYGDSRCLQFNWSEGNIELDPLFARPGHGDPNGTPYKRNDDFWVEGDYHLKSQAGRWESVSGSWVIDEATSPCIDAGDPNSPVGDEPEPNGGRVNMGAYGGTAEASKSYSGG